jgi:hypothetical protein
MFRLLENHHQGGHTTALFKSCPCVRLTAHVMQFTTFTAAIYSVTYEYRMLK